jgi:DNA-directed RNA polymerase subunit beta'
MKKVSISQFKADIFFEAKMGAEAVLEVLGNLDLTINRQKSQKRISQNFSSRVKKKKIMYKIRFLNGMIENEINPEWMVMTHVPVIPPDLRPMVQLTGGRFATSDLNDLYRRLINAIIVLKNYSNWCSRNYFTK